MTSWAGLTVETSRNVYHAHAVSPAKHTRVRYREARALIEFLVSPQVQRAIAAFKRDEYGQSLFTPDAGS